MLSILERGAVKKKNVKVPSKARFNVELTEKEEEIDTIPKCIIFTLLQKFEYHY